MTVLTGVGWHFCAAHRDRMTGQLHGHTYEVIAWHECEHENDAVILQTHLKGVVSSLLDHKELPPELARAEDMAAVILKLSPKSCVEVEIRRSAERLYAKARAEVATR